MSFIIGRVLPKLGKSEVCSNFKNLPKKILLKFLEMPPKIWTLKKIVEQSFFAKNQYRIFFTESQNRNIANRNGQLTI